MDTRKLTEESGEAPLILSRNIEVECCMVLSSVMEEEKWPKSAKRIYKYWTCQKKKNKELHLYETVNMLLNHPVSLVKL